MSVFGMFRRRAGTHGTLSRKMSVARWREFFCVLPSDLRIGIATTEGLLNPEHADVFELGWTQVLSVLCVTYFLAASFQRTLTCDV